MAHKVDRQMTGAAGEFLTAGKLFKRGYQVSVTYGNAKAVDLFVLNPETGKQFAVQVKTQQYKNCFPLKIESVHPDSIYVFVRLNDPSENNEEFFVVRGQTLLDDINKFFGSSYRDQLKSSSMPAVNYGPLNDYKDNWLVFDER
jgi:hypothetical protein